MSYSIVKSISVNGGKVYLTSACNNVYPRTYQRWEATYFTKILQDGGMEALNNALFENFFNGNMQGDSTIYGKIAALYPKDKALEALERHKGSRAKFLLKYGLKYIRKATKRKAIITENREHAQRFSEIDAMLTMRRYDGTTMIAA